MRRILLAAALTLTAATAHAQQFGFSPFNRSTGFTGTTRFRAPYTYRHYGNTGLSTGYSRASPFGNRFNNYGSTGLWSGRSTFNSSRSRLNHFGSTGLQQGYSRFRNGRIYHYSNTGLPRGYSRLR